MKPLIATPCYGGMLCLNYVTSILRLQTAFRQLGIEYDFYLRAGESLIQRARNDCAAHFLAGDWTHLVFIDADHGFEPKSILRLIKSGHDVVAGVCPLKTDKPTFVIDYDTLGPADANGFAEATEAGTGVMCIRRSVLERLATPDLRYKTKEGSAYRFFETMVDPETGEYLSEDYGFCRLWRKIGGKVHVDTRSNYSHQGMKVYPGDFGAALRERG